ncbi:MAG: hypothetical protein WCO96_04045 [Actinomycetes bacterium]
MGSRIEAIKAKLPVGAGHRGDGEPKVDPALVARRDRLVERFTAHQLDLGGVLYEMAIRDHVVMPVLLERAAVLQGVEADLKRAQAELDEAEAAVEAARAGGREGAQGAGTESNGRREPVARADAVRSCGSCGADAGPESAFCSACGEKL